jgi:Flp pilus assembly protein TadB
MNFLGFSQADIEILEITPSTVTHTAVRRTIATACVAVLFLIFWISVTRSSPPFVVWLLSVSSIGLTPWMFLRTISHMAHKRRTDMNMAVAVFLDLINVLLAGGAGIETAVLTAASAGDGWSFNYIRRTLARAQSSRENFWDALDNAGVHIEVQSLRDIAQSIRVAGEHGGRIRQTLASRADALRRNNLAFIEHEAQRRTERMGLPMVAMFVGFVVFIGYPAFVSTVASL